MFLETTAGQNSTEASSVVTILHVVDTGTLTRIAAVGQKERGRARDRKRRELS